MPLISLFSDLPISELKQDFYKETGLEIIFYLKGAPIDTISISELLRKQCSFRYRSALGYYKDFFVVKDSVFNKYDMLLYLKSDFKKKFGIDIDFAFAGKIITPLDFPLPHIKPADIDYSKLNSINQRLRSIEKNIHLEWIKLKAWIKQQQRELTPQIDVDIDFEVELEITYYLAEDDILFKEDYDNIMTRYTDNLVAEEWNEFGIDDNIDHTEYSRSDIQPMQNHCWLFHKLYDELPLTDIQRIGEIETELIYRNQKFYKI